MKKYKISFLYFAIASVFFICCLNSCSQKNYASGTQPKTKSNNGVPDYTDLNHWAAHPWKKDLSDSVPRFLLNTYEPDSLADVFFVHPTTFTNSADKAWNADIDDDQINNKTDHTTILYQASAFNNSARVFAPRYRQAHIRAFFNNNAAVDEAFETAYSDIKTAFTHYLLHYNNNRPIIIASHSQGTRHAAQLLKEFFEDKPLQSQLVCAYIIGLPVYTDYFSSLKPCTDSLQTGCYVSWRTFKRNANEPNYKNNENKAVVVTNPLTWTSEDNFAPASLNMGAVLKNFNKLVPHAVNAQIHDNILWTSKPDIPGKIFFVRKNYHIGDINLFYMNIRHNVYARTQAFLGRRQ